MSCSYRESCTPLLPHILTCPPPHFRTSSLPHPRGASLPHVPTSAFTRPHFLPSPFLHGPTFSLPSWLLHFLTAPPPHLLPYHFLNSSLPHFHTCSLSHVFASALPHFRTSLPRRRTISSPQERVCDVKPDRVVQKKQPSGTNDKGARFPLPP